MQQRCGSPWIKQIQGSLLGSLAPPFPEAMYSQSFQVLSSDQLCSHTRLPKLDPGMCAHPLKWVTRGVVLEKGCGFQEMGVVKKNLF